MFIKTFLKVKQNNIVMQSSNYKIMRYRAHNSLEGKQNSDRSWFFVNI